jgi:ATP-binding cassette, subfamily B, bacterial
MNSDARLISEKTAMDVNAAKELRLFRIGDWILEKLDTHYKNGSAEMWKDRGFTRWAFVPCILAPGAISGIILVSAIRSAVSGSISIPDVTLITLAVIGAQNIGKSMAWWTRSFFGAGAVTRGMELDDLAARPQAELSGHRVLETAPKHIAFSQVVFSYPGAKKPVLDGLELVLEQGCSAAVVGPNGAGKTTLVKLLARLYDPQGGAIMVDGVPLSDISPDSWRSRIAVIFQDFVRYEMSLAENIAVGSIENRADRALLSSVAQKAGLENLLSTLEYSYDTVLARGYSKSRYLSGGEWQRVALARAFAAVEGGAQILVLDEPTANLDVDAEASFYGRFLELTAGLTTLLITHRMASVKHVDRIFVLDDKRIVETGNHTELIEKRGLYAHMFELQARQFTRREETTRDE